MRYYLTYLMLLSLSVGLAQVGDRGGRGSDVREQVTGQKRALIVGISDYAYDKLDLKVADNDADLFRNYLTQIENVEADNIIYLENEQAHAQAIYQGIDELIKVTQEGDEVYIYFAGHGDVVNRENEKVGFLLAHDVNGGRNYRGTDGVVALASLNDFVNTLTTKGATVVMALDACHSGFIYEEGAKTNMNTLSDGDNFVKTTKFLSCAPSQTSQEDATLGHGYFTFYWVLGMMGAADIGAQDNQLKYSELDDFVYEEVAGLTNNQQEPLVITSNRRRLFKNLTPQNKEIAMMAHGKSINLKDTLQLLRSTNGGSVPAKSLSPVEKEFQQYLQQWEQPEFQQKAIALYKNADAAQSLNGAALSRMRFTLSRKLTNNANRLINIYISGPKDLPTGAEFYQESKNVRKAMELLDQDHPSYKVLQVSALFLEAYSYIRNDDYQNFPKAEQLLKEAIAVESRAAYVYNALGILANENHQFKDAKKYYDKAIELIPTWVYPVNNLGGNYLDLYDYKLAQSYYEKTQEIDPNYHTGKHNLGVVADRMGFSNKAEETYLSLLKTDDVFPTLLTNLASTESGKGNLRAADKYYQKALELYPDNVDVLMKYSSFILDNNVSYISPRDYLLKALDLQPGYAKTLTTYADYLKNNESAAEKLQQADSLYRLAITKNPFYTWSYAGLGYLRHKQGDPEAINSFKAGVKANQQNVKPRYYLARFHRYQLKQVDSAIAIQKDVIARNPYYLPAYKELTSIYQSQGQDELAINLVQQFIATAGETPENLLLLGNVYYQKGDKDTAIQYYRDCLEIDPTHTFAAASLALALINRAEFKQALDYAQQAARDNPIKYSTNTFSSAISRKARSLKRKAQADKALEAYELAYQLDTNDSKSRYNYAQELYLQNQTNSAHQIAKKTNFSSKSWQEKWLVLNLKLAIDKKNTVEANQLLDLYKELSNRIDPVLKLLVLELSDKKAAQKMKDDISPAYLSKSRLKRAYNQNTIKRLDHL